MDCLIYVANGLYLTSYLVRDIVYLRALTIVAVVCLMLYFASRPEPLMEVVYWNLLFLILNAGQLGYLLWQRTGTRAVAAAVACEPGG
jgi:hypothetical protein